MLIDTRQDWEYRTGHIHGAINFPIEPTWWSRWRKAGDLQHLLGADRERPIVFY
jgi:rhodanese-related sulfurtransferase